MVTDFEGYVINANNKQAIASSKRYVEIKKLIENCKKHDCIDDFYIVSEEDEVYQCWGMDVLKITSKEIEALKSGKHLYFLENCGEYAGVIYLGEENE